ncbi:pyridoxal phosphate-dependent decarboxylase family protein [Acidobacteriota bacterium]
MNEKLTLSSAEMRDFGYRVIDMIVEHFEQLPDKPVTRKGTPAELKSLLHEPLPARGIDPDQLLAQLKNHVFSNIKHVDHPRFFAFVPGPGNYIGALADALTSGFNVFAGTWFEASGPAQIELTTIDWLRQACGLPETAGGLFVSGGSMANIAGLTVARHIRLQDHIHDAVVYFSDQTHSSIERGLFLLGFQKEQMRKLRSDDAFRIDLSTLRLAVRHDRDSGLKPFCVVGSAGTTNTGAIDPLPRLSEYCKQENLWLHVDGAYGAAAALSERGKRLLQGLDAVDSLSLDPHKWLFQPYEIGCVLVRRRRWLKDTFHILPEYLDDAEGKADEINFCDYGIQLSRRFRALKLWMSLKIFGHENFEKAIHHGFRMAEKAEAVIREMPGWQIVTPAQMAVVNFRCAPEGVSVTEIDALNRKIVKRIIADGYALVTSTTLRGQVTLRFCTINPRITEDDIRGTLQKLDYYAKST